LEDISWLDYAAGGIPAGQSFKITLDELKEIQKSSPVTDYQGINRLNEICFIGLMAYFEGFCKDLFSSIINIAPELIENLRKAGQDVAVDSARVLLYRKEISHRIGFIVAEKYDFGSGQSINALYRALLNITPFSKDEVRIYGELLRDRNLFVHHGGIYTFTYLQQVKLINVGGRNRAYWDSLVIDKAYVNEKIEFLEVLSKKILKACRDALNQLVSDETISINAEQQKAIDAFLWWD